MIDFHILIIRITQQIVLSIYVLCGHQRIMCMHDTWWGFELVLALAHDTYSLKFAIAGLLIVLAKVA